MTLIDEEKLDRLQSTARLVAIAVLVVLVGLIAASGYQLWQIRGEINKSRDEITTIKEEKSDLEAALLKQRSERDKLDLEIADLTKRREDLQDLLSEMSRQDLNEAIRKQPRTTDNLQFVFPHIIRNSDKKAQAEEILERLELGGFVVHRLDEVGAVPDRTQVRYFHDSSVEAEDAARIVEILEQAGARGAVPRKRTEDPNAAAVPPRQYEIWFSEDFWQPEASSVGR